MFRRLKNLFFSTKDNQLKFQHKTVDSQNDSLGIQFPILHWDQDFPHEFRVFYNAEELVTESMYGHWGWDLTGDKNVHDNNELITDSNGIQYTVDHKVYSAKFSQGCSYAGEIIGCVELPELKKKIAYSLQEFFEELYPEKEEIIKELINTVNNTDTFEELINFLDVDVHQI
jgi:hypothetical protein